MYEDYFDNDDGHSTDIEESSLLTLKQYLNNNITSQVAAEQLKATDPGFLLVHAASRLPEAHPQLVELVAALKNADTRTLDGLYIELRESWNRTSISLSLSFSLSSSSMPYSRSSSFCVLFSKRRQISTPTLLYPIKARIASNGLQ